MPAPDTDHEDRRKAAEWRDYYLYKLGVSMRERNLSEVAYFAKRLKNLNDWCMELAADAYERGEQP